MHHHHHRRQMQIMCDAYLCRLVRPGCHLEYRSGGPGLGVGNAEVCN
ncbi:MULTISPECIES: hypothetical protein [unclassified Bradyrhizobium]|nr:MULTISPECIES: hypothetical protein [unclassified Bradyrhizobium]WGS21168.1 hypothetical protein MTX22_05285 [Bradyrhizobium sp. ISRA463]WGS28091.1 hypothetical protein MTX19_03130 [Bradyrhizobium sp. ISRA464]